MSKDTPCAACKYSYMEPDGPLTCGHKDAGPWGKSIAWRSPVSPRLEGGFCGPDASQFEQHPLRNEDGSLNPMDSKIPGDPGRQQG